MTWKIVETNKKTGVERVIRVVSSKPIAERAVMMRRNALSLRGKLDLYDVEARKVETKHG